MPIAPSKWRARTARKSTEQRTRAKRRVFCRDSKGRFASPTLLPDPGPPDINSLLANPLEIGGQQYQVTEIRRDMRYASNEQVTLHMRPIYPQYYTLNTTPLFTSQNYGGTMAYTSQQAWTNWNTAYSTNTLTMQYQTIQNPEITWTGWVRDLNGMKQQIQTEYDNYQQRIAPPPRTPEQIEADRIAADQRRHAAAIAQAERERVNAIAREAQDAASRRALATFVEVLNAKERETYEKEKCIYVRSQHGRRYRIKCTKGQSGNVELMNEHGKATAGFCVHPSYDRSTGHLLPDADAWITQKLFLEHDEDQFLKVANLTHGVRPQRGLLAANGLAMAA